MMSNFFTLGRPSGDKTYDNLGFYQYHPRNNVLPSYVAWIANSDVPSESLWIINFDDETTLLSPLPSQPLTKGEMSVYTMQGVRIDPSAMQKGTLYVVNGKKVIKR
jgi:hypothetical protein